MIDLACQPDAKSRLADAGGGAQLAHGHDLHLRCDGCLVQASSILPAFLLAILVGAIVDNFSRRMVMIVGRV
ncbi:MFS transporter [Phyllobacterium endophyticum]|uniref:MFS transporter n=1 Tax=Phyllobacterium endophyticum TaxID=1149773 RepID=UPI003CCE72D9